LNVYKPLIIRNVMKSIELPTGGDNPRSSPELCF
jgi:hypothetical protein